MIIDSPLGKFFIKNSYVSFQNGELRGITRNRLVPVKLYEKYGTDATVQNLIDEIAEKRNKSNQGQLWLNRLAAKLADSTDEDIKEAIVYKIEEVSDIKAKIDDRILELNAILAEVSQ